LTDVANRVFALPVERKAWLVDRCHELKHTPGAAEVILAEMQRFERGILTNQPISWTANKPTEAKGFNH
jgi:hypothetical protein